jgi:hypothetical protein
VLPEPIGYLVPINTILVPRIVAFVRMGSRHERRAWQRITQILRLGCEPTLCGDGTPLVVGDVHVMEVWGDARNLISLIQDRTHVLATGGRWGRGWIYTTAEDMSVKRFLDHFSRPNGPNQT